MKHLALKAFHFLGSIYFAIFLITSTAAFVIAGTFIESVTDSHRYAALFTYGSPLFSCLLWGFFINILFSAIRRWPFKVRHIPFLITHWGMLMILAGVLIKNYFGTQGTMGIIEGSASDEIFLADSQALYVETREPQEIHYIPLPKGNVRNKKVKAPANTNLEVSILNYTPHAYERLDTWIKGKYVTITGMKPFPVVEWNLWDTPLPPSVQVKLSVFSEFPWHLRGLVSEDPSTTAWEAYNKVTTLIVKDTLSDTVYYEGPLTPIVNGINSPYGTVKGEVQWNWSPISGFQSPPELVVALGNFEHEETMKVPLQGDSALFVFNRKTSLGKAPITIDLRTEPSLFFLKNQQEDLYIFAFDPHGRVYSESYRQGNLGSLFIYDEGYGGYSVQAKLPFSDLRNRKEKENALIITAKANLSEGIKTPGELSPPLQLLREACKKCDVDFVETAIEFLAYWDKTGHWLFPLEAPMPESLEKTIAEIDWDSVPRHIYNGCCWNATLFERLDPYLETKNDLMDALQEGKWPLIASLKVNRHATGPCEPDEWLSLLTIMTQQVFAAAEMLPQAQAATDSTVMKARLLTAYLRASEIHPANIFDPNSSPPGEETNPIQLECPITVSLEPAEPMRKLEENTPAIIVKLTQDKVQSMHTLGYDRFGTGMKWPALQGAALVRFQPLYKKIPYRLRLREARQINYANSQQPYSFESDLLIMDVQNHDEVEKTISMNNVHETWDGYRFYLANIYPATEGAVKRVQIAVNHDPAKYYLTYPGAIIMTIGILLLFGMMNRRVGS